VYLNWISDVHNTIDLEGTVQQRKGEDVSSNTHNQWLSLKDVERLLGIGRTKAYELVATGELPAVRIGRCIRVNRRELDEWLEAQRYADSIRRDVA
jgi:excisionase family DNA binding protein